MGKTIKALFLYLAAAFLFLSVLGPATVAASGSGPAGCPTCATEGHTQVSPGPTGSATVGRNSWNPHFLAALSRLFGWALPTGTHGFTADLSALWGKMAKWWGKDGSNPLWWLTHFLAPLGHVLLVMGTVAAVVGGLILFGIVLGAFGSGLAALGGIFLLGGLLVSGVLGFLFALPTIVQNFRANPLGFTEDVVSGLVLGVVGAAVAVLVILAIAVFAPEGLIAVLAAVAAESALSWTPLIMGAVAGGLYGAMAGSQFNWEAALGAGAGAALLGGLQSALEGGAATLVAEEAGGATSSADTEAVAGAPTGFRGKVLDALGIDKAKATGYLFRNKDVLAKWQRILPKGTRIMNRGLGLVSGSLGDIADTTRELLGVVKGGNPEGVLRDVQDSMNIARGDVQFPKTLTPKELGKMPREEVQAYYQQKQWNVAEAKRSLSLQRSGEIQKAQGDLQTEEQTIQREFDRQMRQPKGNKGISSGRLRQLEAERERALNQASSRSEQNIQRINDRFTAESKRLDHVGSRLTKQEAKVLKTLKEPKGLRGQSVWGGLQAGGSLPDQGQGIAANAVLKLGMEPVANGLHVELPQGAFQYAQFSAGAANEAQTLGQGWPQLLGVHAASATAHTAHTAAGSALAHGSGSGPSSEETARRLANVKEHIRQQVKDRAAPPQGAPNGANASGHTAAGSASTPGGGSGLSPQQKEALAAANAHIKKQLQERATGG